MNIIQNMHELQSVAMCGPEVEWSQFGHVKAVYQGDLVLFNYTREAEYQDEWNWFEQNARGLIVNWKTGETVAWPLPKFWNWLQGGRVSRGHIVTVTEKVDGSCGIVYRDNGWKVATRGSFDSEQAQWATAWLNENVDLSDCPEEYTLVCEIVYPENRIVVEYDHEGLYLLAIRNRFTGDFLPLYPDVYEFWNKHQFFLLPVVYDFNNITDIIAATDTLDANHEGWVVEFSDGQRFKFKGDAYLELHKIVTNTTYNAVVRHMQEGTIGRILQDVPDEFLGQVRQWILEINTKVSTFVEMVETAYKEAPKDNRKEFALWVMKNCPTISGYMFSRFDGQDYTKDIMRKEL